MSPNATIHNTCCGGTQELHKQFHDKLKSINPNISNSDIVATPMNQQFEDFHFYNILVPNDKKFDLVLCISTLEEIPNKQTNIAIGFDNLVKQLNPNGRIVITCDYPDVPLNLLENIVGSKCEDVPNRLNGLNSIHKQSQYKHLNIVLLDLEV
jgi:SAM-dependent methyltransferase